MLPRVALALVPLVSACAYFEVRAQPPNTFDAVIVPGCPSEDDGSLSPCQMSRAAWAAILWRRGVARHFIVSGAAVHSRYVEAEALAAGMVALGVPAERVFLEPNALHTDENMYFSLQIAQRLGFHSLAVASQKGHAAWGCQLLVDWGQRCGALTVDLAAIEATLGDARARLRAVRVAPAADYRPLDERERELTLRTGRRRPPSFLLYPFIGFLKLNGERWIPAAPERVAIATWADRLRAQ
jgi:vancomycin permeability regulator SanA